MFISIQQKLSHIFSNRIPFNSEYYYLSPLLPYGKQQFCHMNPLCQEKYSNHLQNALQNNVSKGKLTVHWSKPGKKTSISHKDMKHSNDWFQVLGLRLGSEIDTDWISDRCWDSEILLTSEICISDSKVTIKHINRS